MKRGSKILIYTALGLALVSTSVYAANETEGLNTLPDKSVIREMKHYHKINEISEKNQNAELKKYVMSLPEKELFETVEEMIKGSKDFEREGLILVPAIKEKWKNGPSKDAHKMIRDKGYSTKFRQHVLDAMFSNEISKKSLENENIMNEVTALINDKTENEMVRIYALKKLKASNKLDHKMLKLDKIAFDSSESVKVRGASIVAMHRTNDPAFHVTLEKIIKNKTITDETLLQYAIVESAKGKQLNKYRKELKELIKGTKSSELKGTITYALAIAGDKEAIKLAVSAYDESQKEISYFAFRNRMNIVMELLKSSDNADVIDGLNAAIYGQIANVLPLINEIKISSNDAEIQALASKALTDIDPEALVDESVLAKEGK